MHQATKTVTLQAQPVTKAGAEVANLRRHAEAVHLPQGEAGPSLPRGGRAAVAEKEEEVVVVVVAATSVTVTVAPTQAITCTCLV